MSSVPTKAEPESKIWLLMVYLEIIPSRGMKWGARRGEKEGEKDRNREREKWGWGRGPNTGHVNEQITTMGN